MTLTEEELHALLTRENFLIIAGAHSFFRCGANKLFALFNSYPLWSSRSSLVLDSEVQNCREWILQQNKKYVVAVGGGRIMDLAKASAAKLELPVVAIPTTFGTGAEVTPFATVYVDGKKTSVPTPAVRGIYYAPDLLVTLPQREVAAQALDIFCHAIESYWSIKSTPESRQLSLEALTLLKTTLPINETETSAAQLKTLQHAGIAAGKAISVAQTTLCHALSYRLTQKHNAPHGFAAALGLPTVVMLNDSPRSSSRDPRGANHYVAIMQQLQKLICPTQTPFLWVSNFVRSYCRWGGLQPPAIAASELAAIVGDGLVHQRAENHPFALQQQELLDALRPEFPSSLISFSTRDTVAF